jgi:hypothetical protein
LDHVLAGASVVEEALCENDEGRIVRAENLIEGRLVAVLQAVE